MTDTDAAPDQGLVAGVVDPHFDRALESGCAPGIAYVVLHQGEVLHARGIGRVRVDDNRVPNLQTAFRIASMTKSFTAATVLSLRDDGRLDLDTPAVQWVPELAGGGADSEVITVRHLLTMGAGLLTDDPWGDRQQDLPLADFRALLARGVVPVTPPGDRFEYSNTGYAVLGLVISAVTGEPYPDVVRRRVLDPLGLHETSFTADGHSDLATGYVRRTDGWHEEPVAAAGAFAPMGGLISTAGDIARWVGLFQGADLPARVLAPVSLREMQRTQRLVGGSAPTTAGGPPTVTGYGFGLFEELGAGGRSVSHSGGYPGFGSHMRWHPASGLAIVALANGTYAPMSVVGAKALADLVEQLRARKSTPLPPLAGLAAAVVRVQEWLGAEDPDGVEAVALRELWADNVERDLPWEERVRALQVLRSEFGQLQEVPGSRRRVEAGTEVWTMTGDREVIDDVGKRKVVKVTVMVAPHDTSLIQSVTLRAVPDTVPAASVSLT